MVNESFIINLVKRERQLHPNIGGRKLKVCLESELIEEGIDMGRDCFFDVLRNYSLLIPRKRNKARTTNSMHNFFKYKNLFKDLELTGPGQGWVSDITYIRTHEGFIYLSLITDAFSRKIIGFDAGDTLEATGCMKSLKKALGQLSKNLNPVHHSDRGSQYCCHEYIDLLKHHNIQISMTEENHCYENAMAERINGILKHEYGLKGTFKTKKQAVKAISQTIKIYNELRPHYSLNMKTPQEVHNLRVWKEIK